MSTTSSGAEQFLVSELFLHNSGGGSCFIGRDDFQNTQRTRQARSAEQNDNGAPCVQAPLPETQQSTQSDCGADGATSGLCTPALNWSVLR